VERYLRAHCFGLPTGGRSAGPIFGAELELIAHDGATRRPARIDAPEGGGTLAAVRTVAPRLGWREERSAKGVVRFVGGGGALTFEPGGQLEYASATHRTLHGLVRELRTVDAALRERAREHGILLLACGIDPRNGPEDAPLQLDAERYRRMDAHFARIGPAGARMMRQTASLQLCIGGVDVGARWGAANALAPWLIALFASSRCYAGEDTGCASYRAETWRQVDPARTGVFADDDPVGEYAAFALGAEAILVGTEGTPAIPFRDLPDTMVHETALAAHLSTLFPEVRPRGYLELRSADAVGDDRLAAALVLGAGLLADERSAADTRILLGRPDAALLRAAGRDGTRDATIRRHAGDLCTLALEGCARLGAHVVAPVLLDEARAQLERLLGSTAHVPGA
jgi:glutamate--cysteine ligase